MTRFSRRLSFAVAVVASLPCIAAPSAGAQMRATALTLSPIRSAERHPLLARRIDVDLRDTPVADALDTLARLGIPIMYGDGVARLERRVTLKARSVAAADALAALLAGTGLGAFLANGEGVLVLETGSIAGRVTDSTSALGVSGAQITATPDAGAATSATRFSTTSGDDGRYRIDGLPPGDYVVVVHHARYVPAERRVRVISGQTTTSDAVLARLAQGLAPMTVVEQGSGYAAAATATGLKMPASVLDIPQSVQTVSQEMIEDRQVATVRETVHLVSGLAPGRSATNELVIRGINDNGATTNFGLGGSNFSVNGLKNYFSGYESDVGLVNVERVEVLKGASGVLYGFNQPGGVVNLVTKQPSPVARYVVSASAGTWRRMRVDADLTGPVTRDSALLYRLNASIGSSPDYRDIFFNRSLTLAPTLTYRVSDRTQLGVELLYARTQRTAWYDWGVPTRDASGKDIFSRVDIQYSSSQLGDVATLATVGGIVKLDHRLSDALVVHSATTLGGNQVDVRGHVPDFSAATPDATGNVGLKYRLVTRDYSGFFSTNSLSADWRQGTVSHRFITGVDVMSGAGSGRESDAANSPSIEDVTPMNVYHPDYGARTTGNYVFNGGYTIGGSVGFVGVYAQDLVEVGSRLNVLAGIRADHYTSQDAIGSPTGTNNPVMPNAGLVFKATQTFSAYASYLSGFEPQVISDPAAGGPFDPLTSSQIEAGVKGMWLGGGLTATSSVYRIVRRHELISANDPANPDRLQQLGRSQSDGVELDVNGRVVDGLSVSANYAHNFARATESDDPSIVGQRLPNAPADMAGAWVRYDFRAGPLRGLGVAAGVSAVSERFGAFQRTRYPGYSLVDAALYYRFDNVSLSVNGNNLSNTTYLSGIWSDFYAQRGLPRNALVKLSVAY